MSTRVNDPATARKFVVMQRLHERDLTGYLVAEAMGWDHLVLPMRYEPRRIWHGADVSPEEDAPDALPPPSGTEADVAALVAKLTEMARAAAPRDAIRPTALQRAVPRLMDGSPDSGRVEEGDLLWPARFTERDVVKLASDLGPDAPGQLAQRPTGESGDVFQQAWFRRWEPVYDAHPDDPERGVVLAAVRLFGPDPAVERVFRMDHLVFFQTIDTALTEKTRSAYTAVATMALTPDFDLIVWNMFRAKLAVPKQFGALKELRAGPCQWLRKAGAVARIGEWPRPVAVQAIEPRASGLGLIQQGQTEGNPFHALAVDGDKVMRAGPVSGMYENGKVYHPHPTAAWVVALEDELLAFPNGAYADQGDVIAYGGLMALKNKFLRAAVGSTVVAETPGDDGPGDSKVRVATGRGPIDVDFGEDGEFPFGIDPRAFLGR